MIVSNYFAALLEILHTNVLDFALKIQAAGLKTKIKENSQLKPDSLDSRLFTRDLKNILVIQVFAI